MYQCNYCIKLRIENGEVVEYDKINISPTIGREDGTFGFGFFEYDTDLSLFIENAEKEIHRVKNSAGLSFSKDTARADVIRYSALPWFAFSEMKHAGSIQTGDSIPKISTGKLIQEKKKTFAPYIHQCPPWLGGWTKYCRIYTELKRRTKQYIMI